jgi:hypothetical protein
VPDDLFARLRAEFSEEHLVALTAFGAMMVATNVVNNALEVPLDEYLEGYVGGKWKMVNGEWEGGER